MGYSLRTKSASATSVTAVKKAAPAAKKAAAPKKTVAAVKKADAPKKTVAAAKKSETEPKKTVVVAKKAAPKTSAVKKVAAPKKTPAAKTKVEGVKANEPEAKASKPTKAPAKTVVKKAAVTKAKPKKVTKAKPAAKFSAAMVSPAKALGGRVAPVAQASLSRSSTPKALKKITVSAPIVTVEEVSTPPLLPEVEPIYHEEQKCEIEKVVEVVEGEVVSSHIRFSDDESGNSNDFEALDDPPTFELYNSESETEDQNIEDEDEFDKVSSLQPVSNAHSALEAFTSQEGAKTFNWEHTGSTYYQEEKEKSKGAEKETDSSDTVKSEAVNVKSDDPLVQSHADPLVKSPANVNPLVQPPTVISNPFGFGFTATTPSVASVYTASHFQSVSSPLDKLCNLTSQFGATNANSINNPVKVAGIFGGSSSLSNMPSSYLPTSPINKVSKSPSEQGDKEQRSPSAIQSIIVDDKHEDFSAF